MRVVARQVDLNSVPESIREFVAPGQVFLTAGKEYDVHAIVVFERHVAFQVVDDMEYPEWYPAWLFDVTDSRLPRDWICNVFRGEPAFVMGPEFIAKDIKSYVEMVEKAPEQVDLFWERVESLSKRFE